MADNFGLKIGVEGEKEFKNALRDINQSFKVLGSEMNLVTSQFDRQDKSIEAVTARNQVLAKEIDAQKDKIKTLESALQNAASSFGESDRRTQSWQIQLNNAKADLNKLENELKQADESVDQFGKQVGKASNDTGSFGEKIKSSFSSIGSGVATGAKAAGTAIAGMAAATAGAAAAAGKLITSAASNADELQKLSDETGLSAEQLQVMRYQGSALGVDLDTMTNAQSKLIKAMSAAKDGTGSQADAFKELGISVIDSSGNLKNSNDIFDEAISKLGGVSNETERDALSMQIFGKSAMELNPLIKAGGDQLGAMADEAKRNGAVMSNDAVAGLDNFGDSIDALKLSAQGMAGTLASAALPMLGQFTGLLGSLAGSLNAALKSGDFSQFGKTLSDGISAAMASLADMATKAVPVVSQVLTGLASALVKAIPTALPALTTGVVDLINACVKILQDNGPMLIKAAVDAIVTLANGLIQALPQLLSAAIQIIISLADALAGQLPTLIPVAIKAVLTLILGLVQALPKLVAEAPKIISSIVEGIVNSLPVLIEMAPQIIIELVGALIAALPQLLMIGPRIFTTLWNSLKSIDWGEVGSNIIKGIIDGFANAGKYISSGIKEAGNAIVSGFKSLFGIHSPSSVMRDEIGRFLGLGITEGIQGTDFMSVIPSMVASAKEKLSDAFSGMTGSVSMGLTPQFAGSAGAVTRVEHTGTITVQGVTDFGQLSSVVDIIIDELRREVRK